MISIVVYRYVMAVETRVTQAVEVLVVVNVVVSAVLMELSQRPAKLWNLLKIQRKSSRKKRTRLTNSWMM